MNYFLELYRSSNKCEIFISPNLNDEKWIYNGKQPSWYKPYALKSISTATYNFISSIDKRWYGFSLYVFFIEKEKY